MHSPARASRRFSASARADTSVLRVRRSTGPWRATNSRTASSYTAAQVRGDGVLDGVSANVWASTVPLHYRHVPLGAVVPWGQGPLLMAAGARERGG